MSRLTLSSVHPKCRTSGNGRAESAGVDPPPPRPLPRANTFTNEALGGGGRGHAPRRDPARVLAGVLDGDISPRAARRDYGVVLAAQAGSVAVDDAATNREREARAAVT